MQIKLNVALSVILLLYGVWVYFSCPKPKTWRNYIKLGVEWKNIAFLLASFWFAFVFFHRSSPATNDVFCSATYASKINAKVLDKKVGNRVKWYVEFKLSDKSFILPPCSQFSFEKYIDIGDSIVKLPNQFTYIIYKKDTTICGSYLVLSEYIDSMDRFQYSTKSTIPKE